MTDMNTYKMLDDTNVTVEAAHVDSTIHAVAGYVNGRYANWASLVAKWGKTKFLLSIDVANNPAAGAQCLDIETGDATIADAPGWFKATQAAGKAAKDLRYYPKLYTSESNVSSLVKTMTAAGVARDEYMIWSAHYTGSAHICGPKSCGCPVQCDATQWTSSADGVSLDESLCYGYFFAGAPTTAPAAAPAVKKVTVPDLRGQTTANAVKALTALGLKAGSHSTVAGTVNGQTPAPKTAIALGATVDLSVTPAAAPKPAPVATPSYSVKVIATAETVSLPAGSIVLTPES